MHTKVRPVVLLLTLLMAGPAWPADKAAPAKAPTFSLPPVESTPEVSKFSPAQLAFVQSWVQQKAPECPPAVSEAVADGFLVELQQKSPEKIDQLLAGKYSVAIFESALLRQVALKLSGSAMMSVRETIAPRRIVAILVAGGRESGAAGAEANGLIAKIKDASPAQYRRLVDGRMEDDDLQLLLKKATQVTVAVKEAAPAKPKVLTATEIVAEFARRNQTGSSLQRLQAYVVEGRIKTATGQEQDLLLFRMRPDRFRLVIRSGGNTRYILAADGGRFWQQSPGQAPQTVPAQALGQRKYLAEFVDPLFVGENFTFERLEDGAAEGKPFHRIAVRRADGSGYVTRIDPETFREVGRENEDRSIARYSDFREVGGVTYAFREEVTDSAGKTGVLELARVSPNPGLIQDLFEPPVRPEMGYFQLEGYLAPPSMTAPKFN